MGNKHKPPGRKAGAPALTEAKWTELALEYEVGTDTIRALAEKHGLSHSTVSHRAGREKWSERREKFREVTADSIRRELRNRYVRDQVRDYNRLEAGIAQLVRQIVEGKTVKFVTKDGQVVEFTADLEANSLDAAVNSLGNALKMKAVLAGVPGDITRQEHTGADGGGIVIEVPTVTIERNPGSGAHTDNA